MKSLFASQRNKFQIKEQPIPEPSFGEVLIKVMAAPINPCDMLLLAGLFKVSKSQYPLRLGIEGSGLVIKSGGGMMAQNILNKMVSFKIPYQKAGTIGSYSQYVALPAILCMCFQDPNFSYAQASMGQVNPVTAFAMLQILQRRKHKSVVSTAAASQLGRMMLRLFTKEGIQTINIVRRDEQVKMLKEKEGAKYVLNSTTQNFKQQFTRLTTELNTQYAFDAIAGEWSGRILDYMPFGSTMQVYGGLSGDPVSQVRLKDLIFMDKTIKGFSLQEWAEEKSETEVFDILQKVGKMVPNILKSTVLKEFPFEQFQYAIQASNEQKSSGKIVLRFNQ